ncbi:glutamate-5-semialdehyde dehydrogenase [Allomyces macrogynus ATCC 38327]|uniref:glutamate-5-semialdehyde dehydrogenase n=1 Tax=Allomyces macrogynus (strain ATCC 38327) TaxID=578462 RepID=A0A0L0T0L8_ALLM3|nr:glutamate-5-semialdehyde dehydrogenase [Allomyces macrogynus ATCC 38327]|eukprot:KNE68124.1 glutamate-5-semialdehyde dehydrogenase [Allomyces macrogynus ATCC 38327]
MSTNAAGSATTTTATAPTPVDYTALARAARAAGRAMQTASLATRNAALTALKQHLATHRDEIARANAANLAEARTMVASGSLSESTFKRLDLMGDKDAKWHALLEGVDDVVGLPDPTNKVTLATKLDDGLELYRVTCPIGVLLIIFEARPEVVVQISALAIKSGNAVILKGGKEASATLRALHAQVQAALVSVNLPRDAVTLIEGRDAVQALLDQDKYIDVVIPRGSASLVRHIKDSTRIPVLGHADGLCSIYVDAEADVDMAARIAVDAKTNYPAACNAAETLLVNEKVVASGGWAKVIAPALLNAGVTLKCDDVTLAALRTNPTTATAITRGQAVPATPEDFDTEFLSLTIAVRVVADVHAAMAHIHDHGSGHTEAIVTANAETAETFLRGVDAAGAYWNASTRFADGFRYGFGAEIGVSTNKTHARGPVGLEGLVIYKYRVVGKGQTVAEYAAGSGGRKYLHEPIVVTEAVQKRFSH